MTFLRPLNQDPDPKQYRDAQSRYCTVPGIFGIYADIEYDGRIYAGVWSICNKAFIFLYL